MVSVPLISRSEGPPPTIDGSKPGDIIGIVEKIDVIARHVTTQWYHSLYYGGGGGGGGGGDSVCSHYLSSCMDS